MSATPARRSFEYLATCLGLLDLQAGASQQQIKQSYRELAKLWHPDRFNSDERMRLRAQDKFTRINEAYGVLREQKQMLAVVEIYIQNLRNAGS